MLGCGDYEAWIQCRGGGPDSALARLGWSSLDFGRRLDEVSEATVNVPFDGVSAHCAGYLARTRAWEWELSIRRNGKEAWVGPLRAPTYRPGGIVVRARDLASWFEWRVLSWDRSHVNADLAHIFVAHAADALRLDPSPRVLLSVEETGIRGDRTVIAAELTKAADPMRELADSGVDWTMYGRQLRAGNVEVPTSPLASLVDDMFDVESIEPVDAPSEILLRGGTDTDHPSAPLVAARVVDSPIGLVQEVVSENAILDGRSAQAAVDSRADFYAADPLHLSGRLHPNAPVSFEDLVPGAVLALALNQCGRAVRGRHRLATVDVSVSVDDSGQEEKITAGLAPPGTDVSAVVARQANP